MMSEQAEQTPLIDLLRAVPDDARQVYEHSPTHHQNIPFGRLAIAAVEQLETLRAEVARLEGENEKLRKTEGHYIGCPLRVRLAAGIAPMCASCTCNEIANKRAEAAEARADRLEDECETWKATHEIVMASAQKAESQVDAINEWLFNIVGISGDAGMEEITAKDLSAALIRADRLQKVVEGLPERLRAMDREEIPGEIVVDGEDGIAAFRGVIEWLEGELETALKDA